MRPSSWDPATFTRGRHDHSLHFGKITLLFPQKKGGETGSRSTASATTQSPESLKTEPLRIRLALARPVRRRIFDIWSLAGAAGRNLDLVSDRKNSGPGADCLDAANLMRPGQVFRIGGSIQRGNRARPQLQCREVAVHRLRPVRAWVR